MAAQQNPLIIGYHARKAGFKTYLDAYQHASQLIIDELPEAVPCPALFISGPRNTHINLTTHSATQLGERPLIPPRKVTSGALLFHASYLDLPWATSSTQDNVFERIDQMMEICVLARADVVIHGGSHIFDPERSNPILHRLALSIERARQKFNPPRAPYIFIETMAHDPRFGSTTALNAIFDSIRTAQALAESPSLMNIGLCIDTAHIWATGANITTRESCTAWFDSLRPDVHVAIHLNDSKEVIGTRHDEHTTLGHGEIWSLADGYMTIIEWARDHNAPMVLERNDSPEPESRADLATIRHKLN